MNMFQSGIACIGRIFLSAIFLVSSILEMMDWASTEQYLSMHVTRWMSMSPPGSFVTTTATALMPWISWILLLAVLFKVAGSLFLIFGWQVRLGAVLLILFLIPTTLMIHDFWNISAPAESSLESIMFMKNLGILGGLFVVLGLGKGAGSKG